MGKPNHELLGKRLIPSPTVLEHLRPTTLALPLIVTAIYGPRSTDRINMRDAAGTLVTSTARDIRAAMDAGTLTEV